MTETMRSVRIKRCLLRVCDGLVTVLCVLAVILVFNRVTRNNRTTARVERKETSNMAMNSNPETEQLNDPSALRGKLTVQVWNNICGGKLTNLFNSPFFPSFFDESYFITKTRAQLNASNYGQRVSGYLHPPETGHYKFVIYSDDGSEFWFGETGSPKTMKLSARVASRETVGSAPLGEIRFDTQISGDFYLERENKYPFEILHLQGTEADFVELQWIRPGKHSLEVIGSEHLSCSIELQPIPTISDSAIAPQNHLRFYLVAFLTESIVQRTLPMCTFSLTVAAKTGLPRFHGYNAVKEITKVTGDWDENWKTNKEATMILQLFMQGLEKIFPRKYSVTRLYNLERFSVGTESDAILYLVELELGCDALDYTERVAEYMYLQDKGQDEQVGSNGQAAQLCYPIGLGWKKDAMVNLVVAVNHEGQRLHRFIEKLEKIIEESLEVDFRLVIVHSGNSGLDIEIILKQSSLQSYEVHNLQEKFSMTRAINAGMRLVHDPNDVILTCDVHVDLPPSIFEDCRKHCLDGRMVFAPVMYSLDCGAYPEKPQGSWCSHDYDMIGMYKKDWTSIGGLDESVTDELATFDLLDRILSCGLHVARMKSSNLYRLFHPEARDPYQPTNVDKSSGYFKEDV